MNPIRDSMKSEINNNERENREFPFSCRNFEFIILRGGIKLLKKVFLS